MLQFCFTSCFCSSQYNWSDRWLSQQDAPPSCVLRNHAGNAIKRSTSELPQRKSVKGDSFWTALHTVYTLLTGLSTPLSSRPAVLLDRWPIDLRRSDDVSRRSSYSGCLSFRRYGTQLRTAIPWQPGRRSPHDQKQSRKWSSQVEVWKEDSKIFCLSRQQSLGVAAWSTLKGKDDATLAEAAGGW